MPRRTDNGARPKRTSASMDVMPMSRRKRDCTPSRGEDLRLVEQQQLRIGVEATRPHQSAEPPTSLDDAGVHSVTHKELAVKVDAEDAEGGARSPLS
eukprot:15441536-Alexandrium_andersonii.AAC.1